jgi:hypothetical protein
MKSTILGAAVAALVCTSSALAADTVRYEIRFDATWTAASHPLDYPANAHFSGLIGATHDVSWRVFEDGGTATPGLEALSERGAHSPLNAEIEAAIRAGGAGALFESGALFSFPGSISATFTADEAHPFVSAVAMVAPSPDWFTGISQVPLRKDGAWIDQATYTLFAWDAGTDNGKTYAAADADAMPRQSVRLNASPHFVDASVLKPVGTVTITRLQRTAAVN